MSKLLKETGGEGGGAASHSLRRKRKQKEKTKDGGGASVPARSRTRSMSSRDAAQLQRAIGNQAMTNLAKSGDKSDKKDDSDKEETVLQLDQKIKRRTQAFNVSTDQVLEEEIKTSTPSADQEDEMSAAQAVKEGVGVLLDPCEQIHTRGMGTAIDVIYLDDNNRVVGLDENLAPNRTGNIYENVTKVLEVSAGKVEKTQTKLGDKFQF